MDIFPLIEKAVEKAGSTTALGAELGVSRPAVEKWLAGQGMRAEVFISLLHYIGGDIRRALPDYDPDADEQVIERRQEREVALRRLDALTEESQTLLRQIRGKAPSPASSTAGSAPEGSPRRKSAAPPAASNRESGTPSKRRS